MNKTTHRLVTLTLAGVPQPHLNLQVSDGTGWRHYFSTQDREFLLRYIRKSRIHLDRAANVEITEGVTNTLVVAR